MISDAEGYQAIIDNKAYSKYSIIGDHHNRMVHNYLENISNYSICKHPIGYFTYMSGGYVPHIDRQIMDEVNASGVHGSGITVSNLIMLLKIIWRIHILMQSCVRYLDWIGRLCCRIYIIRNMGGANCEKIYWDKYFVWT